MRVLAFVDIHGSLKALEALKRKAKQADILVCAGDMSIFEQNLDRLLSMINDFGKTVLMIPGNHETEKELKKACSMFKNIIYIHKGHYRLGDHIFLGYGGGGFALKDPEFEAQAKRFEKLIKGCKAVLVTHAPPHGTGLDMILKAHYGNESIRRFIDKIKPVLVICGHLHENSGKSDRIGNTKIINPGPEGRLVDI